MLSQLRVRRVLYTQHAILLNIEASIAYDLYRWPHATCLVIYDTREYD